MRRTAAALTAITASVTMAGLVREALIAYRFGTGPAADALALVLYYLDFAWTVFFPNAGSLAIVPVVAGLLARGKIDEGRVMVGQLFLFVGLVLAALALAVTAWAAGITAVLLPDRSPADLKYAVRSIQFAAPAIALVALSGIGASVLQGRDSVVVATASRLGFNFAFIALLLVPAVALTAGSATVPLIATIPQLFIILFALRGVGLAPRWSRSAGEGLRDVAGPSVPALLGFGLSTFVFGTVERILLGRLGEGALATVAYAQRTANLGATVTTAITMAAFSAMAYEAVAESEQRFGALRQSLRIGLTAAWLLTGLCVALAAPLVTVLFQRGAFTAASAAATTSLLRVYAAALVPGVVVGLVVRAHYAAGHAWRGAGVFMVLALVAVLVDVVFVGSLGLVTIPAGYACGLVGGAAFGVAALPAAARRACGVEALVSGRAALASVSAAMVVYALGLGRASPHGLPSSVAWLTLGGLTFVASFGLIAWIVGDEEVRHLGRVVSGRTRVGRESRRRKMRYNEAQP